MSAELLRRAAATLRSHVGAVPPGPWAVGNDTTVVRGLEVTGRGSYTCVQSIAEASEEWDDWESDEAVEADPEDIANYLALMHPPVALALADALDRIAWMVELDANLAGRVGVDEMIAVARAVLREQG